MYLLTLHGNTAGCGLSTSCSQVLGSIYASIGGVPIASVGIAVYATILFVWLLKKNSAISDELAQSLYLSLVTPAAAVGIVLVGIQLVYLKAFCPFCALNSVLLVILFGLFSQMINIQTFTLKMPRLIALMVVIVFIFPISVAYAWFNGSSKTHERVIAATIAASPIYLDQLDASIESFLREQARLLYKQRRQALTDILIHTVADKYGVTKKQYMEQQIFNTIQLSDADVLRFYSDNKHRISEPFDQVKPKIQQYLIHEKESQMFNAHVNDLMVSYNVVIQIPESINISVHSNPITVYSKGDPSAKVSIIEFADLQCGHCKSAHIKLNELFEKYPNDIYIEYRHFPLQKNGPSVQFAKGSFCAGEQKKFWEYLDLVYANQQQLSSLKPSDFNDKLGINTAVFNACMISKKINQQLQYDLQEGEKIGVKSTPTFIINGQLKVGVPDVSDIRFYL